MDSDFWLFFITLATQITVSLPSSFFPTFVKNEYGATDATIGVIFAAYPFAQVVSTAFWTLAAAKTSRTQRFIFGLLLSAVGIISFAFAKSIAMFMVSRFIQGVAAQGLLSCSLAVMMQVSHNIQRDVSMIEFAVGVGYMVGPAMGGILFDFCGYIWAFIPLAISYVCLTVPVYFLLEKMEAESSEGGGEYALLPATDEPVAVANEAGQEISTCSADAVTIGDARVVIHADVKPKAEDAAKEDSAEDKHPSWRDCVTLEVGILVLVAVVHAAAQSFKEIVLARHMHLGMGANASLAGGVFTTEFIWYAIGSFWVGSLTSHSRKQSICCGLLVYAAGFLLISNPPFFVEPGSGAKGLAVSRPAEWVLTVLGLSLMGTGSAFVMVPIVPAMLYCYASQHAEEDVMLEEDPGLTVPEEIETTLSGIYTSAWSVGELIGPPLGGLLLELLPETREINCRVTAARCSWAYFSAMSFWVVALCVVPLVLVVALRRQALCETSARHVMNIIEQEISEQAISEQGISDQAISEHSSDDPNMI